MTLLHLILCGTAKQILCNMLLVLDGFEEDPYKALHKVQLLGGLSYGQLA